MAPIAIPNELSDRIIDHLHDDVVTLSACSLTCRSWLPTARYHRFSSVTLGRSFDSFSHLVEASPDVRAVVESLAIIGGSWMRPDDIYSPIFNRMLSNLPAIQHIRLESLQFREPKALELPIALKSLTIYNCWFPDGERLSIFLASFTHIGRLSLRRIWAIISRGIAVQDLNPREYPKVTQLCLGYHHARLEIPSILSHPSIGIQSLCCLIEETTSANHCAIALRTFGSTLSHLDILIDSDSNVACASTHYIHPKRYSSS